MSRYAGGRVDQGRVRERADQGDSIGARREQEPSRRIHQPGEPILGASAASKPVQRRRRALLYEGEERAARHDDRLHLKRGDGREHQAERDSGARRAAH